MFYVEDQGRIKMIIKELPRENYEDYVLNYTYTSDSHYRAELVEDEEGFSFRFTKELLPEVLDRDCCDTLFQPYWSGVTAYGVFENEQDHDPYAVLELAREEWNNRLVITQLLVSPEKRGQGIGRKLIELAVDIAEKEDFRLITLETQTCNIPAIEFYKKCGFKFAGTNLHFYSNDDISENEVMIEMVMLF